jgi:hypothetical protein
MSKKTKRTKAEKIAHIKRSIKKFGDYDGKRKDLLKELRGH